MSSHRRKEWAVFILGILGIVIAGSVSAVKFFTDTCPTITPCPYVFGYPACYFGLAAFILVTVYAGLHVAHRIDGRKANAIVLALSTCGVLFAGYLSYGELAVLKEGGPTNCMYGFLTFLGIAILSYRLRSDFHIIE